MACVGVRVYLPEQGKKKARSLIEPVSHQMGLRASNISIRVVFYSEHPFAPIRCFISISDVLLLKVLTANAPCLIALYQEGRAEALLSLCDGSEL